MFIQMKYNANLGRNQYGFGKYYGQSWCFALLCDRKILNVVLLRGIDRTEGLHSFTFTSDVPKTR
jgi:hypothetical protein